MPPTGSPRPDIATYDAFAGSLDGEYDIRVRLVRGGLNQIRGLQEPHQIELSMDGERVRLFQLDGGSHMYEERYYNADTPSLDGGRGRARSPTHQGRHARAGGGGAHAARRGD